MIRSSHCYEDSPSNLIDLKVFLQMYPIRYHAGLKILKSLISFPSEC